MVESAPLQGETIVYNPETKRFCMLNATAAFLWERLDSPRTLEELSTALRSSFADADAARLDEDVRAVLVQFQDNAMVVADPFAQETT